MDIIKNLTSIGVKVLFLVFILSSVCQCQVGKRSKVGRLKGRIPESVRVSENVWFDYVAYDFLKPREHLEGRFVIAVFGDIAPMTALNFASLAKGYRRGKQLLTYNNTYIHRIVPDFVIQMGDVTNQRGDGGTSIYGDKFRDEDFVLSHSSSGIVAMANSGKDTNNSQFFITLQKAKWLDGHHVVFGKVIEGMEGLLKLGNIPSYNTGHPKVRVLIVGSGIEGIKIKYDITKEQLATDSEDLDRHELEETHAGDDVEEEEEVKKEAGDEGGKTKERKKKP